MRRVANLLYLAAGLGTGGTERHLSRLLPLLPKERFRARVWNAGEEGEAGAQLRSAGIQVECFRPVVSLRDAGRLAWWVDALARQRPALVHSYLYGRHWMDALACRLAGVTYVGSRRNLAHWRQGKVLARERWRDQTSAAIVANCRAAADVALAEGVEPDRLAIIPNGVPMVEGAGRDPDRGRQESRDAIRFRWNIPAGSRVVGSVASLKAIKDPLTLLRGFAGRSFPLPGDRLVLVGGGPLEGAVRREATRLGLGAAVVLAGCHAEPARLLAAFDLFALTSRAEGCSNALLEAMAAGLPVVATRVGGNAEAVIHGVTGLLVPPGDGEALGEAIGSLLADPVRAAAMSAAARRRARDRFSLQGMVDAYSRLYARLVGAASGEARDA
ncbi:MAG: glycosyltransferase [Acidobacteriota bacterium]